MEQGPNTHNGNDETFIRSSLIARCRIESSFREDIRIRRRLGNYRYHPWDVAPFAPTPKELLLQLAENSNPEKISVKDYTVDSKTVGEEIWGKKRCLKCPSDFNIVQPQTLFRRVLWKAPKLQFLKKKLNATKDLLDDFELDHWHRHTKSMNTAGDVAIHVKSEFHPEYCSQAWCKMYECLSNFEVIQRSIVEVCNQPGATAPFLSIHLCEAPGAFVSATNHFVHTNYTHIEWDWLATTLNPHYEGNDVGSMINEDKLILTSMDNWLFLDDTTGNIMNQSNMQSLFREVEKRCQQKKCKVGLVTADGSVDCQKNPSEQEATVIELQFAEIVTALHILGKGGSFILKIFTFLECQTVNHLYLLSSLFTEVHLYKPSTSKEGNSEVYVVCLGYLGSEGFETQLQKMLGQVGISNSMIKQYSLVDNGLVNRNPFIYRLIEAAVFFTGYQMAVIKRNIEEFEDIESIHYTYHQQDILKKKVALEWIRRYNLKKLPQQNVLFKVNGKTRQGKITHVDPREEIGSFNDKQMQLSGDLFEKMQEITKQVTAYKKLEFQRWAFSEMVTIDSCKLRTQYGLKYENILSSRFCFGKLMQFREEMRRAVAPHLDLIKNQMKSLKEIQCASCYFPNTQKSFRSSLDIKDHNWELTWLCCREPKTALVEISDLSFTYNCFQQSLAKFNDMNQGNSLFLCSFPLLSRLQVGFVYLLARFFQNTFVCSGGDKKSCPQGVLFHCFRGVRNTEESDLVLALVNLVNDMVYAEKHNSLLELVPISNLIELSNFGDILRYNLTNTAAELTELMHITRLTLQKEDKRKREEKSSQ